jgi:hypothetical protein
VYYCVCWVSNFKWLRALELCHFEFLRYMSLPSLDYDLFYFDHYLYNMEKIMK